MSCSFVGSCLVSIVSRRVRFTQKEHFNNVMVKISAVVDSGAEANALPENMMQWIPLKQSSASKSGKIFRGAGGDPNPAQRRSFFFNVGDKEKALIVFFSVRFELRGDAVRRATGKTSPTQSKSWSLSHEARCT